MLHQILDETDAHIHERHALGGLLSAAAYAHVLHQTQDETDAHIHERHALRGLAQGVLQVSDDCILVAGILQRPPQPPKLVHCL